MSGSVEADAGGTKWRQQLLTSQTSTQEVALTQAQHCCESNPKGEKHCRAGPGNEASFPWKSGVAGGQQPDQGSRTSLGVPWC